MHDKVWGVGYRKGRYKLVEGIFEDMSYYHESSINALNYSMTENYSRKYHLVAKFGELLFRLGSYAFGNGPFDSVRGAFLIAIVHKIGIAQQGSGFTFLFDIEADPTEKLNLAQKHPDIVEELRRDLELYRLNKPHQGKYWMVLPYEAMLRSLVPGDCTMNINIMPNDCRFKHPFFEGRGIEMEQDNLVNAIHEYTSIYIKQFVWYFFQSSVHFADRLVLLSMGYILISAVCGVKIIKTIYGGFFK